MDNDYLKEQELYFELKGSPESTKGSYNCLINVYFKYLSEQGVEVEQTTDRDIQQFVLFLKNIVKLQPGSINNYISAIKFFNTYVLERTWNPLKVPRMQNIKKLPTIFSREDIKLFIDNTENLKHRAILSLLYGSGIRVGEGAKLKISDICSSTMQVRVDDAKHGTNRYTILAESSLLILREYFRAYFKSGYDRNGWLFPSTDCSKHITRKTVAEVIKKRKAEMQIDKPFTSHTLRICFATHLLEDGVELAYIQQLLGHRCIKTTANYYTYLTSKAIMGIRSPIDRDSDDKI